MSDHHLSETRFSELDMAPQLLRGVEEAGFEFCTPIQAESLPPALAGRDVAGQAQTGTGKTAAFLVATMHRLLTVSERPGRRKNQPRALILSPTRELAIQIAKDAEVLGSHTGLELGLVYGGVDYEKQRKMLEDGVDILIGTPGRIIDYFKQRVFDLKATDAVVIDEADRMFDLGFIKDIRYLLHHTPAPADRLGMLFSATLSHRVKELAYVHMNEPVSVEIEPDQVTVEAIKQVLYHPGNEDKIPLLIGLLKHMDPTRSLIFVNTKHMAERVWRYLEGNGFHAAVLSGDVPQVKRQRLFNQFKSGDLPILVATDVASRGLHIPDVSHVFNFDLPQDPEDYVHRIGRTARAGASGDAVSFACEDYAYSLMDIETYIGRKIQVEQYGQELLADLKPPVRREKRKDSPDRGRKKGGSGGRGSQRRGRSASHSH